MAKTQQDVLIYKEKTFSTAQHQFEKDLRKRQHAGWKLISVMPTKKRGFGRIVQLTAIYERITIDAGTIPGITGIQPDANSTIASIQKAEQKARARAERLEKISEAQRLAREKEEAYRKSLSPEQLRQYLRRKRAKTLIIAAVLLVSLILCIAITASNSDVQTAFIDALTPTPTDTPVPPTPTPTPIDLTTYQGVEAYTKNIIDNMSTVSFGQLDRVAYATNTKELQVTFYISSDQVLDDNHMKDMIKINCYNVEQTIWTSRLKGVINQAIVHIQSDLVDRYGNESKGEVGNVVLTAATAKLFNWNNLNFNSAWDNETYDRQWMLPSLNS